MPFLSRWSRPHHILTILQDPIPPLITLPSYINPHPNTPIPISPPNTAFLAPKLLLLPHLNLLLAFFESFFARSPSGLAVRAGDGDQDTLLADGDCAEAVNHRNGCQGVLEGYRLADLQHGFESFGLIRRVLELLDGLAAEVVAGRACKSVS
jgi:hypothetical protein